ncbi:hypothetical protein [Cellulomonas massiliensis]|uniref:hypothetical protein n=1 Tax=Cellulomonas massiliensis TaxID=1465811 RepID=UPI0002D6D690|nr:hypothetical protein [Cellulomonas massiliensis]
MSWPTVLLLPHDHGWPVRILAAGDPVRVLTGSACRIVVGADGGDPWGAVRDVVEAIVEGRAEEYFGAGDEPLASIGYRVWGPSGERRALDDESAVVAVHRAPAWG